jgi:putative transposase
MQKDKQEAGIGLPEIGVSLDELVRRGARQVIQQVIELELAALLEQYANVRTLSGKRRSCATAICPSVTCSPLPGP